MEVLREPLGGMRTGFIRLYVPHGEAVTSFSSPLRTYFISAIDVEASFRGKGIGKELLRAADTHARELGALTIMAAITSRECLDAMRHVFGSKSVLVENEGTYHPPEIYGNVVVGDTSAALIHKLRK